MPYCIKIGIRTHSGGGSDTNGFVINRDLASQASENFRHERYVKDFRAVCECGCTFCQQRCRHELEHTIFCAAYFY